MLRRLLPVAVGALALIPVGASACGGLVAPNGAVRLEKATTLVAWHGGVEHYMTSFSYQGDIPGLGWIVPLPAIPDKIEAGGGWTLQRLVREVTPQPLFAAAEGAGTAPIPAPPAVVIERTQVEALDITVIKGDGQGVVDWCAANGFTLPAETRAHILAYATTTPVFMAARYDVRRAQLSGRFRGDGTPLLITMRTPALWVPLEVLANADDRVSADLFLLTDARPGAEGGAVPAPGDQLPGAPGFAVQAQEPVTPSLFQDLSTDRNMGWVRPDGWLTYLSLEAPGRTVTYDMSVTPTGAIRLASMGAGPAAVSEPAQLPLVAGPGGRTLAISAAVVGGVLVATVLTLLLAVGLGRPVRPRR